MDDYSRKKWSYYGKTKDEIGDKIRPLLVYLKGCNTPCSYIRCNNAKENTKHLHSLALEFVISVEYTAAYTPQQNGVAERAFPLIRERAIALFEHACITQITRHLLWAEGINTATVLSNLLPTTSNNNLFSPDEKFYGSPSQQYNQMFEFGRVAYITNRKKIKAKMAPKSQRGIFIGYPENYASDCFRFFIPDTKSIVISLDVTWAPWHGGSAKPTENLPNVFQDSPSPTPSPTNMQQHHQTINEDSFYSSVSPKNLSSLTEISSPSSNLSSSSSSLSNSSSLQHNHHLCHRPPTPTFNTPTHHHSHSESSPSSPSVDNDWDIESQLPTPRSPSVFFQYSLTNENNPICSSGGNLTNQTTSSSRQPSLPLQMKLCNRSTIRTTNSDVPYIQQANLHKYITTLQDSTHKIINSLQNLQQSLSNQPTHSSADKFIADSDFTNYYCFNAIVNSDPGDPKT